MIKILHCEVAFKEYRWLTWIKLFVKFSQQNVNSSYTIHLKVTVLLTSNILAVDIDFIHNLSFNVWLDVDIPKLFKDF